MSEQTVTCRRCNRPLRDPDSVAAGIGPVCASYEEWANAALDQHQPDTPMPKRFTPRTNAEVLAQAKAAGRTIIV